LLALPPESYPPLRESTSLKSFSVSVHGSEHQFER
jgi:hypothetical protein